MQSRESHPGSVLLVRLVIKTQYIILHHLMQDALYCYSLTSRALPYLFLLPETAQLFRNYSLCFEVPIIPEIIPA